MAMGMYDDDIFSIKESLEELEKYSAKEYPRKDDGWGCLPWLVFVIMIEAIYFMFFNN